MKSWIQNDELFFAELAKGNKWAQFVSDFMSSNEIPAYTPKGRIRENISEIEEFSVNEKDIMFENMDGHLEVKSRNLSFGRTMEDYPYETAFVDTLDGWNRKAEKPLAVILVSQKTSEMLVIPVSTKDSWGTESKYDTVRGIHETWITVHKTHLRPVEELISWLKTRQLLRY
jgi:hypothetical protein